MKTNVHSANLALLLIQMAIISVHASSGSYSSSGKPNKFIDKTIPEAESFLTEADFQNSRNEQLLLNGRKKRQLDLLMVGEPNNEEEENGDDSAMYNKDRFEGDIVNPKISEPEIAKPQLGVGTVMRNAVKQSYLKWPNGRIPYSISSQYTSFGRARIAAAIQEYQEKTCIKFEPKTDADLDYVHVVPEEGCYSMVGKTGGKQPVSIGNGCIQKGIIIHELMHSVGFFHEQSRADRDSYINIVWSNVETGLEDQFDKYSLAIIDHLGTKYDYGSVMHYGPSAFSKNGKATIEPLEKNVKIGQRIGFSDTDLVKINKLYNCPNGNQQQAGTGVTAAQNGIPITVTKLPDGSIQNGNIPAANCADLRDDCLFLAQRGHCFTNFAQMFMKINCPMSCNHCMPSAPPSVIVTQPCEDERPWCSRFARNGLCQTYLFKNYMESRCPLSCGAC